MKILKRRLQNDKKEIGNPRNKEEQASNRQKIIHIVVEFYESLYKNQQIVNPQKEKYKKYHESRIRGQF